MSSAALGTYIRELAEAAPPLTAEQKAAIKRVINAARKTAHPAQRH